MKKLVSVAVLTLILSASVAMADPYKVFNNQTASTTFTKSWDSFGRMSISGTFDNATTGSVYIQESTNGGASYSVLQGYSTAKTWNYDIDTTKGAPTNILLQYNRKTNTVPRKKANVWINVR